MIAYFDIFSGISGDMTLGALVDLGVPASHIKKQIEPMLSGFELNTHKVFKSHLAATDIEVTVTEDQGTSRNYTDIRAMIEDAPLSAGVKANSLAAFEKIARAEADIHGKDIETVHFHEIGGVDSIVDIVGSFMGIEYLGITRVVASEVPLGSGFIECDHGKIPVPVPATIAILKDIPVTSSDAKTEIVTPTGAAVIATLADKFGPMPRMQVKRVGYGSGKRETGSSMPNLLRIVIGEAAGDAVKPGGDTILKEEIQVLKTNIDDMSPEALGSLMDELFEKNALDVTFIPVHMKKNRPATQVEVMCRHEDLDSLAEVILTSSSSIGVRYHACGRSYLPRQIDTVQTRFGSVAVKTVHRPDGRRERMPEYDDVARVAREKALAFKAVYDRVYYDANFLDRD